MSSVKFALPDFRSLIPVGSLRQSGPAHLFGFDLLPSLQKRLPHSFPVLERVGETDAAPLPMELVLLCRNPVPRCDSQFPVSMLPRPMGQRYRRDFRAAIRPKHLIFQFFNFVPNFLSANFWRIIRLADEVAGRRLSRRGRGPQFRGGSVARRHRAAG